MQGIRYCVIIFIGVIMKMEAVVKHNYKDYLESLKKEELELVLKDFNISYDLKDKKEILVKNILDNLENRILNIVSIFQNDELSNIKKVIKNKGYIKIKKNSQMRDFIDNLTFHFLAYQISDYEYYVCSDVLKIFKNKINLKTLLKKIKSNTKEYNYILGLLETYGVCDYDFFFELYSRSFISTKEDFLDRLRILANFYNEFIIYEKKKNILVANKALTTYKMANKLYSMPGNYRLYSNDEIIQIHNYKYCGNLKSYKKLIKFLKRNYGMEKRNIAFFNKNILSKYLTKIQLNEDEADDLLKELIDVYFEIKNEKQRKKFINLMRNISLYYPNWSLKGNYKKGE